MNKNKTVSVIDIGSDKVVVVIAQVAINSSTLEKSVSIVGVAAAESRGVKKGQIVNIDDAIESTVSAVEAAERMAGYNLDHAFISVGGAHIASQNSNGVVAISDPDGEVNSSDVERVIEAASAISLPSSRELIHVVPRDFIVDGEGGVKDPIGMSGVRLEVQTHLVTASKAALKNLSKTINEVGVDVDEMVFSGLASSEAVLSPTEKELGCVLVDIGSGTTSVAAFTDGALCYSGTIPIGGRNVTNDLAIGLRVSLESAEKIKLMLGKETESKGANEQIDISKFGGTEAKHVSKRTLTEGIIRPRLNEIFTIVKLDLEKAGITNKIPSGVILTGGGALTVGVAESAKKTMSLPVRVGIPGGVGGLIDDILTPSFSTALGLVLYGASRGEVLTTASRHLRLPTRGVFSKIVETIKELLP
jgi:cell division protein FtsA